MALRSQSGKTLISNLQNHHPWNIADQWRFYDSRELRPMVKKRIERRSQDYPIKAMVPVAQEVLRSRNVLIHGVSSLLKAFPIVACKFCPEVYIGEEGHMIKSCNGFKRQYKNQLHQWNVGNLSDILVPVEAFHLRHMFQDVIKHDQRFDYERVPAVLELCCQAGANPNAVLSPNKTGIGGTEPSPSEDTNSVAKTRIDGTEPSPSEDIKLITKTSIDGTEPNPSEDMKFMSKTSIDGTEPSASEDIKSVAKATLAAWEALRHGVERLLLVYPAKVCEHCSEVHVGPSGHLARNCGVFKFQSWRGKHFWKKAEVDDLVPPKIVWRRRPQDPSVLVDEARDFYGRLPAVVDLCSKAGAVVPVKYNCMMKIQGLSRPVQFID